MITRRSIIFGLIAAPIVVRMGLIMPVKRIDDYAAYDPYAHDGWGINYVTLPTFVRCHNSAMVQWSVLSDPTVWS